MDHSQIESQSRCAWWEWVSLALLLTIGALVRWPQIPHGIPAAVDPDSVKTVGSAQALVQSWRSGEFQLRPLSYQYPPFYIYTIAGVLAVLKPASGEMTGRAVAAVSGWLAILPIFLLARRLSGPWAGLFSATFVCLGFLFVEQGRRPAPDSLQMLLLAASAVWLFRTKGRKSMNIALSGILAGLATGTKYTGFVSIATVAAFYLSGFNSFSLWLASTVIGFLIAVPIFLIEPFRFISRLRLESLIQKSGGFGFEDPGLWGYFFGTNIIPLEVSTGTSLAQTMGFPFALAGLLALAWSVYKSWRIKDWRLGGLAVSCLVFYGLIVSSSRIPAIRFLLPFVIFLTVLISITLMDAASAIGRFVNRTQKRVNENFLAAVLFLFIAVPGFLKTADYLRRLASPDSRLLAAEQILQTVPSGEKILNFMYGPALPARRYQTVQWTFPEYVFELIDPQKQGPSVERLREENIRWVIWNSYYTYRFWRRSSSPDEDAYFAQWRRFYADLKNQSDPRFYAQFEAPLSPEIELFALSDFSSKKR